MIAAAAVALAGCVRHAPMGAEAAYHAAGQPTPVLVATTPQPSPKPSAQEFVEQAGASDAFEIAAAETAAQRAQNPEVRALATVILHDHTVSEADLKTALAQSGQSLSPAAGPSADQQARLSELQRLDPRLFDKAYIDGQVQAHQTALPELQNYAGNGDVVALSSFAAFGASMVQDHLTMARSLGRRLP
jgi:putative membrane protein